MWILGVRPLTLEEFSDREAWLELKLTLAGVIDVEDVARREEQHRLGLRDSDLVDESR